MTKNLEVTKETNGNVVQQTASFFSGPIPPAAEFAKYETILKGSADRILKMSENQSKHRQFIEKIVVIFDSISSATGLIFAFLIAIAGIGSGVYLIVNDKEISGFASMLTPLAIIVGAFVYQKRKPVDSKKDNQK